MTDCVYFLLYLALGKLSLMLLINYYFAITRALKNEGWYNVTDIFGGHSVHEQCLCITIFVFINNREHFYRVSISMRSNLQQSMHAYIV